MSSRRCLVQSAAFGAALAALAAASGAWAQTPLKAGDPRIPGINRDIISPNKIAARLGAGTLDSPVSLPWGFEFNADQGESELTVKGSVDVFGDTGNLGVTDRINLTAKFPIAEGDNNTALAALKGLGNATSLEAKYSHVELRGVPLDASRNGAEKTRICHEVLRGFQAKNPGKAPDPVKDFTCRIDGDESSQNYLDNTDVQTYAPHEIAKFRALFVSQDAKLYLWGVTAAAAEQTFDYRDPATLAEQSVRRTPWSVGGYWAVEPLSWNTLFTFRAEHKQVYKENEKEIRCLNPQDTDTCVEAVFGVPQKEKQDIVSFEVRRRFGHLGFVFTTRYDVGEDEIAFELPIYLIRDDADGGFNGGIRATWDSKTEDARVGVFMNKAYCFFCDLNN